MKLHPDQLLTLACVAKTGNLTHAGRLLGISQPAVSTQMRMLSEAVGEPLIVRERHGVSLAAAGIALLPAAEAIARSLDVAEDVRVRLQGTQTGSLRVITNTSIATYLLPPVLALFRERHPLIDLLMIRRTAAEAVRSLEKGEGDLALAREPFARHSQDLVFRRLFEDETVLAVRPDHPYADRRSMTIRDLDNLEIVTQGHPSGTRSLLGSLADHAGISFRIALEVLNVEAIKEAVLQGFGGGFISRLAIDRELQSGELRAIHIAADELRRPVYIVHPPRGQDSSRLRAFLQSMADIQSQN